MSSKKEDAKDDSVATQLVEIGEELYEYVCGSEGVYGLPRNGPPVAVPLRGSGPNTGGSVRQKLQQELWRRHHKPANQSALADAMNTLEAKCMEQEETYEFHLRVAPDATVPRGVWIDLGRKDGHYAYITPNHWEVTPPWDGAPYFRRTRLIEALPAPDHPGDNWRSALEELRKVINVSGDSFWLLIGWLLAAITPSIPRPIGFLTGEQGTGKSTVAEMLTKLIDTNPAPIRGAPATEHELAVSTAASWVYTLDNLSGFSGWMSDALCRIVTGDGRVSRALYSDTDVSVLRAQRPVLVTGIDVGAVRSDLADRMMTIELDPIPAEERRQEAKVWQEFHDRHPRILGGLYELASRVYAELDTAEDELTELPRMADFGTLLHAMDRVVGCDALASYNAGIESLTEDVINSSPLLSTLTDWLTRLHGDSGGTWEGTPGQLLEHLNEHAGLELTKEKGWPKTSNVLTGQLKRGAPALRKSGYGVEGLDGKQRVNGATRKWLKVTS